MSGLFDGGGWHPTSLHGEAQDGWSRDSAEASADHSTDGWPWPLPSIQGLDDDDLGMSHSIYVSRVPQQNHPCQILQEGLQDLTLYPPHSASGAKARQPAHPQPLSQPGLPAAKRSAAASPTAPPSKRRLRSNAAKENVPVTMPGRAGTPCFETWTPSEVTKSYKCVRAQPPLAVSQPFGMLKGQGAAGRMSLKDINSRLFAKAGAASALQPAADAATRTAGHAEGPQPNIALGGLVQLVGPCQSQNGANAAPMRVLAPWQLSSASISITVLPGPSQRLGPLKLL